MQFRYSTWIRFARCLVISALLGVSSCMAADLRFVFFDIEPYASRNAEGVLAGRYVDLAKRIAQKVKVEVQVQLVPFARVAHSIETGQSDVTISFATEPLDKNTLPLTVMEQSTSVILLSPGRQEKQLSELGRLEIGRLRGGCKDLAEKTEMPVRFYDLNNIPSGVRMLASKRLDGVCATRQVFDFYLGQEKMEWAQFGPVLEISQRDVWVYVAKTMPSDTQKAIKRAIAELRKENRL